MNGLEKKSPLFLLTYLYKKTKESPDLCTTQPRSWTSLYMDGTAIFDLPT